MRIRRAKRKNLKAENELLRRKLAATERILGIAGLDVPPALRDALGRAAWAGSPVKLTAGGRDVWAVLGPEGADAAAIWAAVTAAAAVLAEAPAAGLRLIPPSPLAQGLRAVAFGDGDSLAVVASSNVTGHQRATAARKAVAAVRGRGIPAAAFVPLAVPWWRKGLAAVLAAAASGAVLVPSGVIPHSARLWPPPPAAAGREGVPGDHAIVFRSPAAGGHANPGHPLAAGSSHGMGTARRPAPVPSPGTPAQPAPPGTSPPAPRPSPSTTLPVPLPSVTVSASVPPLPLPSPTVKVKVCVQWQIVLGLKVCVRWKLVVP